MMAMEGVCHDANCEAHGKTVICSPEDEFKWKLGDKVKCPCCGGKVTPTSAYFGYDCFFRVSGQQQSGAILNTKWKKVPKGKFSTWRNNLEGSGLVEWARLEFFVRRA
jgi:hypothetical protein